VRICGRSLTLGSLFYCCADNCPFAQRFWIAALEKEDDPKNPKK